MKHHIILWKNEGYRKNCYEIRFQHLNIGLKSFPKLFFLLAYVNYSRLYIFSLVFDLWLEQLRIAGPQVMHISIFTSNFINIYCLWNLNGAKITINCEFIRQEITTIPFLMNAGICQNFQNTANRTFSSFMQNLF